MSEDRVLEMESTVQKSEEVSGNRDNLLRFIETYRELPVLWDTSLKEYANREKKNTAYDEFASNL
jgi:hypothetical protein